MKIVSFLVCDDIRNELGGKHSLMGVYSNSIEFQVTPEKKNQWPKSMRMGIFASINIEDDDRKRQITSFGLAIDYNGQKGNVAKGDFRPEDIPVSHSLNIAILHNNFVFKEAGDVRFSLEFSDSKDRILETIVPDYVLKISEKSIEQPKTYRSKHMG